MSHFVAYFKCFQCKKVVGGLISNDILIAHNPDFSDHIVFNPLKIQLQSGLKIACQKHAGSNFTPVRFDCMTCGISVIFFYYPATVVISDGEKTIEVPTKYILMEVPMGQCSYECQFRRIREICGPDCKIAPQRLLFDNNP